MNQIQWKGIKVLVAVEIFFATVGVCIHEWMHSLSFFVVCGRFGEIHIMDTVAYDFHTIAVIIPPQGLVIKDVLPFELVAYGMMFLLTGVFAFIFIRLFYSDFNLKKSSTLSQ